MWIVFLLAWHTPVHTQITRAALDVLPVEMRQKWAPYSARLSERYCLYPDRYANAAAAERDTLRIFCEKPDKRLIHNVTWRRAEDLESVEYLLRGMIETIRSGQPEIATQYAGTLAHFLEDSTCPAHALIPADSPLNLMKELLPPPPGKEDIKLHTVIERSAPEFDLGAWPPRSLGKTVGEAAAAILDRCYAIIRENRARLLDLVRAAYADNETLMNENRHRASVAGAELLADAYYTGFVLSRDAPAASVRAAHGRRSD